MNDYKGTIIEESLEDKSVLNQIKIISTKIEDVTDKHKTPWIKQWTLHKVEILENEAEEIATLISKSLDHSHQGNWYADFKNESHHYIIFRDKVFFINDRRDKEQYDIAREYGISVGIPEYQVGFEPVIDEKVVML